MGLRETRFVWTGSEGESDGEPSVRIREFGR